jgi:hypothetical protein
MKRAVLLAVPIAFLLACGDHEVTPPALNGALVDGSQGGNPNFFFLPPVAPNPIDHITRGAFDPAAPPTIAVYKLPPTPPATCTGLGPAVFGPVTATLVAGEEHYIVLWNTLLNPPEASEFYRICAFAANGGVELGFADVDPVQGGMKNVRTQEYFAFQNGRDVPIKTRVQFCANASVDCTTQFVDAEQGGTVLADEASVFFPPNVLPGDRLVVIEEVALGEGETCLDRSDLIEVGPCYQFRTIPGPTPFNGFAIAAICPLNNLTGRDRFRQLFQEESVDPLADAPPTGDQEGVCQSRSDVSALDRAGLGGVAAAWRSLRRYVAGLIGPRPLYAATAMIDKGAAGSTPGFSRFVNAIRPQLVKLEDGDNQEGAVGSTLRIDPSVRVDATHSEDDPDDPPPHGLGGIPVTFTFRDPAGAVMREVTVFTDVETGIASTPWTLGDATGEYTLVVSAGGFIDSPVMFRATGLSGVVDLVSVDLTSTALTIEGVSAPYTVSIDNGTGASLSDVGIQTWIDQGTASRAAGGVVVLCGAGDGVLPPGACSFGFSLNASNTNAGTGTLGPGSATARFQLLQGSTVLDTFTIAVTLAVLSPP